MFPGDTTLSAALKLPCSSRCDGGNIPVELKKKEKEFIVALQYKKNKSIITKSEA